MNAPALRPISWETWALQEEADRRFRRLVWRIVLPLLLIGIVIPFIQFATRPPETPMETRYAELLRPPPPPPKVEEPKPEPERKVEPKPQLTQEQKLERARFKARRALSQLDALAELRDKTLPTVDQPLAANVITTQAPSNAFRSSVAKGSGGIGEVGVVQRSSATGLGSRAGTSVSSGIGSGGGGGGGEKLRRGRSLEEIQAVFDRTKGAFFSMYVREQRQNPDMIGKMIVKITIAPSGAVTKCTLVSSELRNPEFEKKVLARVQLMDFGAKDVPDFTLDYPILFFPS